MRKLTSSFDSYGVAVPPTYSSLSQSPAFLFPEQDAPSNRLFLFPSSPIADSAFDFSTLSFILALLLLSLLSMSLIFHLRLRARYSHHLQNFNSLWTFRLLLVSFIALWALNEILRLPFFRRRYLQPFFPFFTLNQQANLCKVHILLSLGFFEPGFLITLLFLVNISIKKPNPRNRCAAASVCVMCFPIALLQSFFLFFSPLEMQFPNVMHRSFVILVDRHENKSVMCSYPLLSTVIFAAFTVAFSLGFLLSCWRVLSIVINKGIRIRINILLFSVITALMFQVLLLSFSTFWTPENAYYTLTVLAIFLCVVICAGIGEGILIIKPIFDALAAGDDCCQWNLEAPSLPDVERRETVNEGRPWITTGS